MKNESITLQHITESLISFIQIRLTCLFVLILQCNMIHLMNKTSGIHLWWQGKDANGNVIDYYDHQPRMFLVDSYFRFTQCTSLQFSVCKHILYRIIGSGNLSKPLIYRTLRVAPLHHWSIDLTECWTLNT